jgi:hypothetical protein
MDFIKKWDIYGKPVTFYYNTSTVHKTIFGAILSILSFSLMTSITIFSLINFLYQKPNISSNIVYFIKKKYAQLEVMAIKGKLSVDEIENTDQIDDFVKYFRIVLHEKYYDEVETFHVAKIVKVGNNDYEFNVTMSISDVFKEKEFSTLKLMSCADIKKMKDVDWASPFNETTCDLHYQNYLSKNYKSNSYLLSFDAPNYTIDRKGSLTKVPHQNELRFKVIKNQKITFLMETKYVVIEDDTNIYYTHKKYDAYFTMKRPIELKKEDIEDNYRVEILMQNTNNDQIVLISLYKYKLLDFLAKLGGIMKIITFMKMTGKFWSSFFYEQTLYNLLVKRENPYLKQKIKLLESLKNSNKLKKIMPIGSGESYSIMNRNIDISIQAMEQRENNGKHNKEENYVSYASYCSWFMNRFCKSFFLDEEAKQKRELLAETLGLNNYLLHLDFIDRQILLEQHTGEINNKIEEILIRNNQRENGNCETDNTNADLQKDIKGNELTLIDQTNENNMEKPLYIHE